MDSTRYCKTDWILSLQLEFQKCRTDMDVLKLYKYALTFPEFKVQIVFPNKQLYSYF